MAAGDAPLAAKATLNDAVIAAGAETPAWLTVAKEAFANGFALNCALAAMAMAVLALVARKVLHDRHTVT